MTDSDLLREIIQEKGLKYQFLAKKMGLTPYGLSLKIDNENEFKASEISILSNLLDLTQDVRDKIFFAV